MWLNTWTTYNTRTWKNCFPLGISLFKTRSHALQIYLNCLCIWGCPTCDPSRISGVLHHDRFMQESILLFCERQILRWLIFCLDLNFLKFFKTCLCTLNSQVTNSSKIWEWLPHMSSSNLFSSNTQS